MVYLDFRSLCLIIAMRRSGRGSGRHLVSYSLRFTLTASRLTPHLPPPTCDLPPPHLHTLSPPSARGPRLGPALGLVQPEIYAH